MGTGSTVPGWRSVPGLKSWGAVKECEEWGGAAKHVLGLANWEAGAG